MVRPPPIAFRAGLTAWTHYYARLACRVELASSSTVAPLFLSFDGERIRWTPEPAEAELFINAAAAWDRVVAEALTEIVRVTCRDPYDPS